MRRYNRYYNSEYGYRPRGNNSVEATNVVRHDSSEAYLEYVKQMPRSNRMEDRRGWGGVDNWDQVFKLLANGDASLVPQAERIMDQVKAENIDAPGVSLILPSVVGFMPNVPAAIIGHPESMFSRQVSDIVGYQTPLSIYVETTISAGVEHHEIMNKGIAILAFAMYMQAIRPVEIFMTSSGSIHDHSQVTVVKVASNPIDLSRACFMLTSPTYARKIGYSVHGYMAGRSNYGGHNWAWGIYPECGEAFERVERIMRQLLGMEQTDIFIGPGYLYDYQMRTNPVAWIKEMIEKHTLREAS